MTTRGGTEMKRVCLCLPVLLLILLAALLLLPERADAIPAFARKHGFNCNMCHTAYPKLNDFGQRVRADGYQIPGQEGKEKSVFDTPPPIAFRTFAGAAGYDRDDLTTWGFELGGLDVLGAGVMHKNVSLLLIYTPRIDEPSADFTGSAGGANPSQLGALESANIVFSNVVKDMLNVRVGRFEPSYHPFSSKRTYYLGTSYDVYTFETPGCPFVFDDNQVGVELTGHARCGGSYGLGVVNGTGASPDDNKWKDVYLRVAKTFGPGEGQSAGQRIGVFGYYGHAPVAVVDSLLAPGGEAGGTENTPFYRYGGDVSLNWKTLNLQVFYMKGTNDKDLSPLGPAEDYEYDGGFAQLDCACLPNNRLVTSVLYNWVAPPSYDDDREVKAYSGLVRYYLGDWSAVNVALHGEYTYRETGCNDPLKENLVSLMVDFAF
jgi:hypothetical protein